MEGVPWWLVCLSPCPLRYTLLCSLGSTMSNSGSQSLYSPTASALQDMCVVVAHCTLFPLAHSIFHGTSPPSVIQNRKAQKDLWTGREEGREDMRHGGWLMLAALSGTWQPWLNLLVWLCRPILSCRLSCPPTWVLLSWVMCSHFSLKGTQGPQGKTFLLSSLIPELLRQGNLHRFLTNIVPVPLLLQDRSYRFGCYSALLTFVMHTLTSSSSVSGC